MPIGPGAASGVAFPAPGRRCPRRGELCQGRQTTGRRNRQDGPGNRQPYAGGRRNGSGIGDRHPPSFQRRDGPQANRGSDLHRSEDRPPFPLEGRHPRGLRGPPSRKADVRGHRRNGSQRPAWQPPAGYLHFRLRHRVRVESGAPSRPRLRGGQACCLGPGMGLRHCDTSTDAPAPIPRTTGPSPPGTGPMNSSGFPPGRFLVFAYGDKNRNSRLDAGEPLALPRRHSRPLTEGRCPCRRSADVFRAPARSPAEAGPGPRREPAPSCLRPRDQRPGRPWLKSIGSRFGQSTLQGTQPGCYVLTGPQQAGEKYRFSRLVIEEQQVSWDQPWRASTRKDRKAPSVVSATPSEIGDSGRFLWRSGSTRGCPRLFREVISGSTAIRLPL